MITALDAKNVATQVHEFVYHDEIEKLVINAAQKGFFEIEYRIDYDELFEKFLKRHGYSVMYHSKNDLSNDYSYNYYKVSWS